MSAEVERLQLPLRDSVTEAVTAALHRPEEARGPAFLLTPGASGHLDSAPLVAFADALAAAGLVVVRVNLPYTEAGRRTPPRAERAVDPFRQIAERARRALGGAWSGADAWVLGGKSYGGRVASLAVATGLEARGLCFYGYPLHPPGRAEQPRVDHWARIGVPCLFLQGSRDRFCDLSLLDANLHRLPRRATVEVVEGGDHSLAVARSAAPDGRPRAATETLADLAPVVATWARALD